MYSEMGSSLRNFIKDVRAAKTLADERAIITKQSAKIRTRLRDDHLPHSKRRDNIQKLLYLYILGEKTHFGQVECINLIASDNFVDKRLGYLAAILLLQEDQDLLTLLTNMLNNDLRSENKYIVSLALTALGCLGSAELSRDVYPDVETIINTSNDPFILKKALQCSAKLIKRDASLLDIFPIDVIDKKLLNNQLLCTHSVLLGICEVLQSILSNITSELGTADRNGKDMLLNILATIASITPKLFAKLPNLYLKSVEPAYDVQGIQDPFLQCELIVTLKWVFKVGNEIQFEQITALNDKFNDLLTQISTNTNSSKNAGQAVLYEISKTIFELNSNDALRTLGINILANLLKTATDKQGSGGKHSNKRLNNNNIKYVALNGLLSVVRDTEQPADLQRYRKFISSCLYDHDISIRFRALELTFAITDEGNLIQMCTELIAFLEKVSKESQYNYNVSYFDLDDSKDLISYTVDHLVAKLEMYPAVEERAKLDCLLRILNLVGNYIDLDRINDFIMIVSSVEDTRYKIGKLSGELMSMFSQREQQYEENAGLELFIVWCIGRYADMILMDNATNKKIVNETSITDFLVKMDDTYRLSRRGKMIQYILTAALRLSAKIKNPQTIARLRELIESHNRDPNLMIQVKSNQYKLLFDQPPEVKKLLLKVAPKMEMRNPVSSSLTTGPHSNSQRLAPSQERKQANNDILLDLLSDIVPSTPPTRSNAIKTTGTSIPTAEETATISLPADSQLIHTSENVEVFSETVSVTEGHAQFDIYIKAKNEALRDVQLLCAVPKSQKLTLGQLHPGNDISSGGVARQTLRINGSGKLKLRVKLAFRKGENSAVIDEQFDYKFSQSI